MDNIEKKVLCLAKEWDEENPAMKPLKIPNGYRSIYVYKQPIIHAGMRPAHLPSDSVYEAQGRWGIVSTATDHELTQEEKNKRQDALKDEGMTCIGAMRLVKQTFKLSK